MNKQLKQTLEKCNVLKKVEIYSKSYGYITTLILPISGTFEAVGTGGCNVHFYRVQHQLSIYSLTFVTFIANCRIALVVLVQQLPSWCSAIEIFGDI